MTNASTQSATIIRTERGLSIAGTRITLYAVMDCVAAGWPPKLIRDRLNLSEEQVASALEYISTHQSEVEAECQQVLQAAEESRRYWEERNRERVAESPTTPPEAGLDSFGAKLEAWKRRLDQAP
jgi:uncharacterized protein (DUF433 family)